MAGNVHQTDPTKLKSTVTQASIARTVTNANFGDFKATVCGIIQADQGEGRTYIVRKPPYTTLIDDTTTAGKTYIGFAAPGTLESASYWQILCYDETGAVSKLQYAQGTEAFTREWDERTTYSYS